MPFPIAYLFGYSSLCLLPNKITEKRDSVFVNHAFFLMKRLLKILTIPLALSEKVLRTKSKNTKFGF